MMNVDKKWFVNALKQCGAVKFGSFTLASGRKSDYYIDIKVAITQPTVLRAIARAIAAYSSGCSRIAGVELGAVPIAAAVSLETELPYIMVRKEKKEHGTQKSFEGELHSGDKVLFVEDVVTTGGTLAKAIESLRRQDAVVERVVCVVDREEGGEENLRRMDVQLLSLLRGRDLTARTEPD